MENDGFVLILVSQGQNRLIISIIFMKKIIKLATPLAAISLTYNLCFCSAQQHTSTKTTPAFKSRKQHIRDIQDNPSYDVLIIGGGCNGTGVLLDSSTRGLRSLLIQKDDFASGASSKSTKLIHGGVRYLQQVFDFTFASLSSRKEKFNLVKEAIVERSMMIDSAEHLTAKIPFVIPCTNVFSAFYYYAGSLMYYLIYDWFALKNKTSFKMPYFIDRQSMKESFPHMSPKFSMGVVYEDGSFNDARLLLTALLTATSGNGVGMPDTFVPANVLNRAQFIDFIKNGEGKIVGGIFKDTLTDKVYKVNAKYVINCTGVWADKIRLLDNPKTKKRICMVGGSHIVYDNRLASPNFGLTFPSADGRVILVQPWLNRVLAGTTQKKIEQPTNNPTCSDAEREFLNKSMMDIMSQLDVSTFYSYEKTRWCGIRPLVAQDADNVDTKSIARTHVIEQTESGLLSLMGGKWTVYRRMGQDVVDLLAKKQMQNGRILPSSQTPHLPLLGSAPESLKQRLLKQKGDVGVQLYNSFGWMSDDVMKGSLRRVYGSTTLAQLQWIVRNEMVTSIEDVLMRRTRLCFLLPKTEVLPLAEVVGRLIGVELRWSQKQIQEQIKKSVERIVSYEFQ